MMPLLALALAALAAAQEVRAEEAPVALPLELLPHAQLNERLRRLESDHPDVARVLVLGRSREGREVLALRLAAGDAESPRPAILVVANIDGPDVFSSAVALWEAEELAAGASEDARRFLETTTLYVVPRANPDAAQARFGEPLQEVEATGRDVDTDRDGRSGEDPPADVDGDGRITWLRAPDPEGEWIEDPADARAMIRAERHRGERGRWKLWTEGRDADGDERVAEDAAHDTWLGRNFPEDWREHDPTAGLFPMDEPEARALAEFLLLHRDVALVVTYGSLDNLVEKPKSVKADAPRIQRLPQPGVLEPDAEVLAELGARYAEVAAAKAKGRGVESGSFQGWVYRQMGLPSLAVVLWDIPLEDEKPRKGEGADGEKEQGSGDDAAAGAEAAAEEEPPAGGEARSGEGEEPPEQSPPAAEGQGQAAEDPGKKRKDDKRTPSDDAKRLKWIDAHGEGERFVPWRTFEHPELGPVEIGGFAPFARLEPPEGEREAIARAQLDFLRALGSELARVELVECTALELAPGLVRIEAVLTNSGLLPLLSASARRTEAVRPAKATLRLPEGAELLSGNATVLVESLPGAGGRSELRWLVRGAAPGAIAIEVETDHAGTARCRPEVK